MDASLFRAVNRFAGRTTWLHPLATTYASTASSSSLRCSRWRSGGDAPPAISAPWQHRSGAVLVRSSPSASGN